MKTFTSIIITILVCLIIVVGGMKIIKSKKDAEAQSKPAKVYSVIVKTFTPRSNAVQLTLPFLATTKKNDDVKISSKVPARINYIAETGNIVEKGEVVVKLDDNDFKTKLKALSLNIRSLTSQLKSKKIALGNLGTTHQRTEDLMNVRGASEEQFDKEVTGIEALKAGIKTIEYKIKELEENKVYLNSMLSYTNIVAPVTGVVTNMANTGDVTMPGKPLIAISSNSNSYVLVRLPRSVQGTALIYRGEVIQLKPLNTTFNGLLEYLANIDEGLAADQRVEVDVVIFDGIGFKLPLDTVLNREGRSFVLVIANGRATPKEIEIIAEGEQGVVVNNVSEDEKLAVAKPDILLRLLSGVSVKGL